MAERLSEERAAEIAAEIGAHIDNSVDVVRMYGAILEAVFVALRPWPEAHAMAQVVAEHVVESWPKRVP